MEDITGIRIEREGKTLTLTRTESTWSAVDKKLSVDQETVNRMLTALTETRAKQLDTGADATAALKTPNATVTLSAGEVGEFALEMYGDKEGDVLVRRKDEPALLHMAADTAKWWDPSPLGFRNRIVATGDAADIDRITVTGEVPQTLEKKGDLWHLTAPVDAPADATAVRSLTGPLAEIHVERFVAEKAEKAHGFDRPFATITARFAISTGTPSRRRARPPSRTTATPRWSPRDSSRPGYPPVHIWPSSGTRSGAWSRWSTRSGIRSA